MAILTTAVLSANTAYEFWRASGLRTLARLDELVSHMIELYHGDPATWDEGTRDMAERAVKGARAKVQPWDNIAEVTNVI